MCRIVTPDDVEHHHHPLGDPLEIAEVIRQSLAEELASMNDLTAQWQRVDDEGASHALYHVIEAKREVIARLWQTLQAVEEPLFSGAGPHHGHDHRHG